MILGAQRPLALNGCTKRCLPATPFRKQQGVAALGFRLLTCRTSSAAATPTEPDQPEQQPVASPATDSSASAPAGTEAQQPGGILGWFRAQQRKGAEGRAKLASLGLAAVLAYGCVNPYGSGGMLALEGLFLANGLQGCSHLGIQPLLWR